ncbi:MAG: SAF domain-containing protein [Actinomycetaceae bacterium]|nr:SAF domain-containing protein [Actinomycetaceae bacterium]
MRRSLSFLISTLTYLGKRFRLPLIVLVAALVAFGVIGLVTFSPRQKVVAVVSPAPAGAVLTESDVTTISLPSPVAGDALTQVSQAVGQRLVVPAVPQAPLRQAYFQLLPEEDGATVALEVEPAVAGMVASGDKLDIWAPCSGEQFFPSPSPGESSPAPCSAQLLASQVVVKQVQNLQSSQWSAPQTPSLIIQARPEEIKVLAGVSDPRSLTIAIVSSRK